MYMWHIGPPTTNFERLTKDHFNKGIKDVYDIDANSHNQSSRLATFDSIHDFKTFGTNPIDRVNKIKRTDNYYINSLLFNFNRIACNGDVNISIQNSFLKKPASINGTGAYDNKPYPVTSVANIEDYFVMLNLYRAVSEKSTDIFITKVNKQNKESNANNFRDITEKIIAAGYFDTDGNVKYINTITDVSPVFRKYYMAPNQKDPIANIQYRALISQEAANDPAGSLNLSILDNAFGRSNVLIESEGQSRTYKNDMVNSRFEPTLKGISNRALYDGDRKLNFNTTLVLNNSGSSSTTTIPYSNSGNIPNPNDRTIINSNVKTIMLNEAKQMCEPAAVCNALNGRDDGPHSMANAFYKNERINNYSQDRVAITENFTRKRFGDVLQASLCGLINSIEPTATVSPTVRTTVKSRPKSQFKSTVKSRPKLTVKSRAKSRAKSTVKLRDTTIAKSIAATGLRRSARIATQKQTGGGLADGIQFNRISKSGDGFDSDYIIPKSAIFIGEDRMIIAFCIINKIPCIYDNKNYTIVYLPKKGGNAKNVGDYIKIKGTLPLPSNKRQKLGGYVNGGSAMTRGAFKRLQLDTIWQEPYYFMKFLNLHLTHIADVVTQLQTIELKLIEETFEGDILNLNDSILYHIREPTDEPNTYNYSDTDFIITPSLSVDVQRFVTYSGQRIRIEYKDIYGGFTHSSKKQNNQSVLNLYFFTDYLNILKQYELYSIIDETNDAYFYDINDSGVRVAFDCICNVIFDKLVKGFLNSPNIHYESFMHFLFEYYNDLYLDFDEKYYFVTGEHIVIDERNYPDETKLYFDSLIQESIKQRDAIDIKMNKLFLDKSFGEQYKCAIANKFTYYGFHTISYELDKIRTKIMHPDVSNSKQAVSSKFVSISPSPSPSDQIPML